MFIQVLYIYYPVLSKAILMGLSWCRHSLTAQLEEFRGEIQRRDQEILAMSAKMKTLEEQHQDYQRHIAVLKESLCAKEEHYNMLQADVSIIEFILLSFIYKTLGKN